MKKQIVLLWMLSICFLCFVGCEQNAETQVNNVPSTGGLHATAPTTSSNSVEICTHEWTDWSMEKNPTCQQQGQESRSCVKCNEKQSKDIASVDHEWGEWKNAEEYPSCDQPRNMYHECMMCGEVAYQEFAPSEHQYEDWTVESEYEIRYRYCLVCYDRQEEIFVEANKLLFYTYGTEYYISSVDDGYEQRTAVLDRDGQVVYRFEDGETILGKTADRMITRKDGVVYLKDYSGRVIVSSEELGTTNLVIKGTEYIMLYKVNEKYNGTTYEVGFIDKNGEWVSPMSEDHPLITCGMECNEETLRGLSYLGEGFLCVTLKDRTLRHRNCLYSIKENKIITIMFDYGDYDSGYESLLDGIVASARFENGVYHEARSDGMMYEIRSDGTALLYNSVPKNVFLGGVHYGFYIHEDGTIYTMSETCLTSDKEEIMNFAEEGIKIQKANHLGDGKWLVLFTNDLGSYYYSILNYQGNFVFDPIKTDAVYIVYEDNGRAISKDYLDRHLIGRKIVINENGEVIYECKDQDSKIQVINGVVCESVEVDRYQWEYTYTKLP